ncbi:8869_t:CDS:2 [Acaulospora morrowiae]|uniref:8869_t:CDS:1 n=1 Tax=Acaulospora morrowiae TaxID=94023 RepID=A0A9N8V5X1_9GLOM|nr:8869_t:CDS:2 [Acaulospora morrowiae]
MVRKLFRWISKAGDVAKNRLKRQEEQENEPAVTSSRRYRFDYHPAQKKKHQSLPISPRKSQVVDSQARTFTVDKRRYAVVDPFNFGHHRSQSADSTRNLATILSGDFHSQIEAEAFLKNPRSIDDSSHQKMRLEDLAEEVEEETPATILVAKKEKLTRHSQLSIHSVRHITRKSMPNRYNKLHDKTTDRPMNFHIAQIKYSENTLKRSLSSSEIDHMKEISLEITSDELLAEFKDMTTVSKFYESDSTICPLCKRKMAIVGHHAHWCQSCESKRFEEKFGTWTSGNDDIDCFILETQLDAKSCFDYLEWIPYDRLRDVRYVGSGRFGSVYRSIWIDGPRDKWDKGINQYMREGMYPVALKSLDNSQNISQEFLEGLRDFLRSENNGGTHIIRFLGISRDPDTKNYMWVLQYARDGDLTRYLTRNPLSITWQRRLEILYGVSIGLASIHKKDLMHQNLHSGNVLIDSHVASIGDLGMYGRSNSLGNKSCKALPFVAPEISQNKPYTKSADIYSFGCIMWELATNKEPFAGQSHNSYFAVLEIGQGLRPEITENIPDCYARLMQRCLEGDPLKRPSADELQETIGIWFVELCDAISTESSAEFQRAEERRKILVKIEKQKGQCIANQNHPRALLYTNRLVKSDFFPPETHNPAVIKHMASETELYNLKAATMQADNTSEAAEIYDLIQYW